MGKSYPVAVKSTFETVPQEHPPGGTEGPLGGTIFEDGGIFGKGDYSVSDNRFGTVCLSVTVLVTKDNDWAAWTTDSNQGQQSLQFGDIVNGLTTL